MSIDSPSRETTGSTTKPEQIDTERWLAAIVESSDDAIIGESLEGIITSWNPGAQRIFGYSADESIGKPITSLTWPGAEEEMDLLLQKVRLGDRVDHFQVVRRHKNGSKILISLSLSPIIGEKGQVIGIAKIARDITGNIELEESLSASTAQVRILTELEEQARAQAMAERRFRELIEHAPDGIVQVDQRGTINIANRTAERMFGYPQEELVGLSVEQLVPEKHRASHPGRREAFGKAGVTRPTGQGLDLYARRKDGSEFPVEISLSPVQIASEVLVTAVIRDVSERKRTQEQVRILQESYMAELEARQKETERLSRIKSEAMAGISHELRTPLHTIIGFSDLLKEEFEGPLNDTQRSFVEHIRKDSEHLLNLINDVLDLSRMEVGALQLHTESLAVNDAISAAVNGMRMHAEAKGVTLVTHSLPGVRVIADPMRLHQILYNLLGNAVKFTPGGGEVSVGAVEDGRTVYVSVRDTGVGISHEEQSRIFERFYQVGYTTGGAGLGLAICKQLVEMQGGTISVDSEPGQGSQFSFSLQVAV